MRFVAITASALLLVACAPLIVHDASPLEPAKQPETPQPALSEKSPPAPTQTIPPHTTKPARIDLTMGETKKISNGLIISFTKILADSRCPHDTECIRQGDVTAQFVLRYNPPQDSRFEDLRNRQTIKISKTGKPVNAWGWKFTLADVFPSKRDKNPLRPHEYSVIIEIAKQGTPPAHIESTLAQAGEHCGQEKRCAKGLGCNGLLFERNGTCITEKEAQSLCENIDGVWNSWGRAGLRYCNPHLPDSNHVCNDNAQCEGYCIADSPESRSGHCQELRYHPGCFSTLRNDQQGATVCIE